MPTVRRLCAAGLHDPRVSFWEPAKFAAKLRALAANRPAVLLRVTDAGHFGASGAYSPLRDSALKYAFLLRATCSPAVASFGDVGEEGAAAPLCVPCVAVFVVVVAGLGGLVAGAAYYSWQSSMRGWRRIGQVMSYDPRTQSEAFSETVFWGTLSLETSFFKNCFLGKPSSWNSAL
jgi:oligopeptidase B